MKLSFNTSGYEGTASIEFEHQILLLGVAEGYPALVVIRKGYLRGCLDRALLQNIPILSKWENPCDL